MAVRSNYIKSLMENKNSLEKQYQQVIAESMQNIMGDKAKEEVRKLLKESEDEDSYEEEEVNDDTANTDKETDVTADTEEIDSDEDTDDATEDVDGVEETDELEDELSDDLDGSIWDDLEKCKSADGEYDCRGMDDDKLIKVVKELGPEDGIRVMSNGDGTVEIEVDGDVIDGTQNFIIELEDDTAVNESDTSYTLDDYQKVSAIDGLSNHETANPKTTYSMDAGVPTGTERPWAHDGDKQPYSNEVNEDVDECGRNIFEVELEDGSEIDEASRTNGGSSTSVGHGVTMSRKRTEDGQPHNARNMRLAGRQRTRTTNAYEPVKESIEFKKSMNMLYKENKDMKSIIPQLQKKLMESMVINQSMGFIVRLLNENATTVDEKKQISDRFSKVNTLEEGKQLYETISAELKNANKRTDMSGVINGQLAEGKQAKQSLVETTMYKSEKVNETLNFMKRLNAIK